MKKQLLLCTAAAVLAFGAQSAIAQNIAIVNGKAVPKTRLDALAQQVAKAGRPVTPEMQGQLREEVIAREVFMQEAEKQGLSTSDEYKMQMELARQTILIRALFADYQQKNKVTDAELKAAKALIVALKKGGKFEELARKQSKDAGSGANGGDLDWANPSSYVAEFTEAMLKLNKGQLTETPVKTQFGYHVIRVDDIRTAALPPFAELKPQIAQQIEQQRLGAYQQGLREKAKVE